MKACVAVSDGYHIYRIKRMMGREGIDAFGSPRPAEASGHSFICARSPASRSGGCTSRKPAVSI